MLLLSEPLLLLKLLKKLLLCHIASCVIHLFLAHPHGRQRAVSLELHPVILASSLLTILPITVLKDNQRIHPVSRILHSCLKVSLSSLDHWELLIL